MWRSLVNNLLTRFTMYAAPDIIGGGGFTTPVTGSKGYFNGTQGISFHEGQARINDIPDFNRNYSIKDALVTRIEEGRFNMMRVLFDYARRSGAYVVTDTQIRYALDVKATARFYLKTKTNQGGTAGSEYKTGTFVLANVADAKRLQSGDLVACMWSFVPVNRSAAAVTVDYSASPAGGTVYQKVPLATAPLPEICKVTEVNYTTGAVTVERNQRGDSTTTDYNGLGVTVVANGTGDPGANCVRNEDAFFIKMTRPLAEGKDDATIWNSTGTFDYNYCQYIMRKWGSTDIRENIQTQFNFGKPSVRNKQEALEQFFEELEYYALFGYRKEGSDPEMRWIGNAGGFLEWIDQSHYEVLMAPDYTSSTKMGDFTIPNFNKKLENKFYYGAQQKLLLAGVDFHTAFSVMINKMTQNIPNIVSAWSVQGHMFKSSNGGTIFVTPSDTMSLNGLSHMAILFDPSSFQYGHLQNMDITVVDNLPSNNIHEKTGEIYGVFTFKRTNKDANWVFIMQPNTQA